MNAKAVMIAIVVVVGGLIGIQALADATLTTHDDMDPDSRMEVVFHGSMVDGAEQPLEVEMETLFRYCQLEVGGRVGINPIEDLGDDRFQIVMEPAIDAADQRQFRGCIGDINVDHVQASVERMTLLDQ